MDIPKPQPTKVPTTKLTDIPAPQTNKNLTPIGIICDGTIIPP